MPSPKTDAKIHLIGLWVWVVLIIPTLLWWGLSIKWVSFMSIYACVMGHYSAWQAAKADLHVKEGENNV